MLKVRFVGKISLGEEGKSTLAVGYKVGKVTSRRVVSLPEICVRHIEQHAKDSGPVIESSYAQWRGIKKKTTYEPRPDTESMANTSSTLILYLQKISYDQNRPAYVRDVLRHTAIHIGLELYPDKHELPKWAGNSPAVIDEHYRAAGFEDKKRTPNEYARRSLKNSLFVVDSKKGAFYATTPPGECVS